MSSGAIGKEVDSYGEWRKNLPPKISKAFWKDLTTLLTRQRITRTEKLFNPQLLAYGHTHPSAITKKYHQDTEAGPSLLDLEEPTRPELIFTPYADKWLIHQVICGESTLVREYPRSIKP